MWLLVLLCMKYKIYLINNFIKKSVWQLCQVECLGTWANSVVCNLSNKVYVKFMNHWIYVIWRIYIFKQNGFCNTKLLHQPTLVRPFWVSIAKAFPATPQPSLYNLRFLRFFFGPRLTDGLCDRRRGIIRLISVSYTIKKLYWGVYVFSRN